jgi:hypothetical protein
MTRGELERRLTIFQHHYPLEKIQISDHDPIDFHVALTLKPNVPISDRLIVRLQETLGEPLRSIALLRSRANVAVLRFTARQSAAGDETEADRVEETVLLSYAKVGVQERSAVAVN